MSEKEVHVDSMNIVFAKVVKIWTWVSLTVMIFFGSFYLIGIRSYLDISSVAKYWGKPVGEFWKQIKGSEINDYSWFLSHLNCMDSLSMMGISFLCLTSLIATIFIIPKAKKIYAVLLLIIVAEFIFSIIRPLI